MLHSMIYFFQKIILSKQLQIGYKNRGMDLGMDKLGVPFLIFM